MIHDPNHLSRLNQLIPNTLMEHLGIEFLAITHHSLTAGMPIGPQTSQPQGLLHGGALLALAETTGSALSYILNTKPNYDIRTVALQAHHLNSTSGTQIEAVATLFHQGNKNHLIDVKIFDNTGLLLSVCRMTNVLVLKSNK